METVITIADAQSIYFVDDVDRALGDGVARRNEGLKSWFDRMRELGGSRYIIKPSTTAAVDDLATMPTLCTFERHQLARRLERRGS